MESKNGRTPVSVGQEVKNINPVASESDDRGDISQQVSEPTSSATSASSSKVESSEKPTENEKSLDDNNGMQICPDCNIELDPNVHKFCYGCGKPIQEICSIVSEKRDTSAQASNRVTVVAGYITEAKKEVSGETQRTAAETVGQGSQQPTAMTMTETRSVCHDQDDKETSQKENTSYTVEVTLNNDVVEKEVVEIKDIVVEETVVSETWAEDEKKPFSSQEKSLADDESKSSKSDAADTTEVDNLAQAPDKILLPSADLDFPGHVQKDVENDNGIYNPRSETPVIQKPNDVLPQLDVISKDLGGNETDDNVNAVQKLEEKEDKMMEKSNANLKRKSSQPSESADIPGTSDENSKVGDVVQKELDTKTADISAQTLKGEQNIKKTTQRKFAGTFSHGSQQSNALSGKASGNENVEAPSQEKNGNDLNASDVGHSSSNTTKVKSVSDVQSNFDTSTTGGKTGSTGVDDTVPPTITDLKPGAIPNDGKKHTKSQTNQKEQETLLSMVEKKITDRLPAGGASVSASGGSSAKNEVSALLSVPQKKHSDPSGAPGGAPGGDPGGASGGAPGNAPGGGSGGVPGGVPGGDPSGAPGGDPSGAPGGDPSGAPGGDPSGAPGDAPGSAAGSAPGGGPGGDPGSAPGGAPGSASGSAPGSAPGGASGDASDSDPVSAPVGNSGSASGGVPGGDPGSDPGSTPGGKPSSASAGASGSASASDPGSAPAGDPGSAPRGGSGGSTAEGNNEQGHFYQKSELKGAEKKKKSKNKEKGKNKNKNQNLTVSESQQETITVIFHAIVSEKFKLDDVTKIVIRGEDPVFKGWNKDGVVLEKKKNIQNKSLVRGEVSVPLRLASFKYAYKYVLLNKKNKPTYEEVVEFQGWIGITNRCLVIEKEYLTKDNIYHKYDGFIYPERGTISLNRLFSTGSPINDRRVFFEISFPKWSGFMVDSFDENIQPVEALQNLACLVEGTSNVWTSTSRFESKYPYRHAVDHTKLRLSEVLERILMPKIQENLKVLDSQAKNVKAKVQAMVSSVAIAYVFTKYHVFLKSEKCEILFKCLRLPADEEACSEFVKTIKEFDEITLSSFNKIILQFYKQQSERKSLVVNFIPALPVLHFLQGESKPFKELACEKPVNVGNLKWWGLDEFRLSEIRKNIKDSEALAMLRGLKDIFNMDPLLKRTFLLLCPVEIFGDLLKSGFFSCLELCVTMRKLLPDTTTSSSYTETFVKNLTLFFEEINKTLLSMSPVKYPKERQQETMVLLNNFVVLVENVKQHLRLREVDVLCHLVECLITGIVLQKKGIDLQDKSESRNGADVSITEPWESTDDFPKEMISLHEKQSAKVDYFLKMKLKSLEYSRDAEWHQELQSWTKLLSLSAPKVFYQPWHDKYIKQFETRISKVPLDRQIKLFCLSEGQKCHADVLACLSDTAFKAVEKVVKGGHGEERVFNQLSQDRSIHTIKLLSTMLDKAWPPELKKSSKLSEKEKDVILLKHLLTWSTWPGFLKFFGSRSSANEELTRENDCEIILARAETFLDKVIESVENGTVTIATLELLEQHSDQFLKLGEIHQKNKKVPMLIRNHFLQRCSEKKAFFTVKNQLQCFINLSYNFISVDDEFRNLREKNEQDYSDLSIRVLCTSGRSGRCEVKFFNLHEKSYEMVSKIPEIKDSRIFDKLWQKYGKRFRDDDVVTIEKLCAMWLKVCDKLASKTQEFLSGKMQLRKIDKYVNMFGMNYTALEDEFALLSRFFDGPKINLVKKKLRLVIEKVKKYRKLFDTRLAAQAILELQNALELQGDFSEVTSIEKIIRGNFERQAISIVSDELLKAGECLEAVTLERRNCLMTFTKCLELVTWLRESIKDEQELKVFVDLAMISAGEEDLEIDRISCMHTSCLGFGPLIFRYRQEHGFSDLMKLCEPVWQAVSANPSITQKLVSTMQSLSWLKQIKESHGSVALTTMAQVKAINSFGVYYIADRKTTKDSSGLELHIENLVSLVVPEDKNEDREEKVYSLEEIKDVQSKLMLIAGKKDSGKEEVDQFNRVFEGILRVSYLYLQLCEVGEINYLTWKRKFRCSKVEGYSEKLLNDIEETCEKLECELKQWKKTINNKRHQCYSLNQFTMKQILYLRKELARACTGQVAMDELPLQMFMLLETVDRNIDPLVLANVLRTMIPENSVFLTDEGFKDAQKYFASNTVGESSVADIVEEDIDIIQLETRRRKNSFETLMSAKEKLEQMRYTEEYLLAALNVCGRRASEDDLVACVVNMSCEYDEEYVMKLCEEAKENQHLSDLLEDVFGFDCVVVNDEETFLNNERTFERGMNRQKRKLTCDKPYVHNEKDTYLTLEVLADILEEISAEAESDHVQRKLPSILKEGEPNLLLVPKGEVFGCILSLFMGGRDQPLPTDEEVIVCDENTTAEEIELLWRRAMVDNRGLLFCLANADLLDYDVSQQAVRSLETLTQGRQTYHLVVICNIESEDKSNMIASLDQFRRQFPPVASVSGIQSYLKGKLVVSGAKTVVGDVVWEPAATVDMEKLSVRVVQSSRAGVGKSLVVKHLAEQLKNLPNNKKLRKGLVNEFCSTIPVHGISVDSDRVTHTLRSHACKRDIPVSRIFHLDMSQSVVKGLDNFLFKLVILRVVKDHSGNVWRRKSTDMYVVEITTDKLFETLTTENPSSHQNHSKNTRKRLATNKYSFLKFLPRTHCLTPRQTLDNIQQNKMGDTGFDVEKFHSEEYQRTFQYLMHFAAGSNLDQFSFIYEPRVSFSEPVDALKIIIKYCGIRDPSWAELHHFVNFLNIQLRDCEESVFCDPKLVGDILQGFRTFVVRFMIQMSRDFATRSLCDNTLGVDGVPGADETDDLAPFQIRRRWELSPHPYIFFNHDRFTMTFLGFRLNQNGDLLDPGSKKVLENMLMDPTLRGQLNAQGVDFDADYEQRDRLERIVNLCSVMGIEYVHDPDPTYELTTDNVEKILAIHMRFRCGIPVIIMGETGCGKTRLIRFMCELQAGPDGPKNLLLMKVHGGTSYAEIEKKVKEAEKLALCNEVIDIDTILFFDEANTTDAIDLIKEIMVDRRVNGRAINPQLTRLHFIAACNPYRKHTKEMIQKLESAGLGYHVSADETEDKLGSIPLRQLVYRVHPLPESMRPLVWDFGQLTHHTEELYTKQIVRRFVVPLTPGFRMKNRLVYENQVHLARATIEGFRGTDAQASGIAKVLSPSQKYVRDHEVHPARATIEGFRGTHAQASGIAKVLSASQQYMRDPKVHPARETIEGFRGTHAQASCIAKVLSASQKYMRDQENECSFVSLRDVERAMKVITWFHSNSELIARVIKEEVNVSEESSAEESDEDEDEDSDYEIQDDQQLSEVTRAVILGIGVCYYARLNDRRAYCKYIWRYFDKSCPLPGGGDRIQDEIVRCQRGFLDDIQLGQNIAKNIALSENVFMMAICTELRIPLFVVGKPGSSKSLAKDVISTNMKAANSQSELFKNLKQIHMQSYQCSPLSTPEGIVSTFRQCAKLQKDKDLNKFVSVVVLDEIGLAEDSPLMPLKTLHPLLEDGTATAEESGVRSDHHRVGFIGLSNWALDPAKMNRGIMLSRGVPTEDDLCDSARGICSGDEGIRGRLTPYIGKLCSGYLDLYKQQSESDTLKNAQKDEFFGLRDFYSLVKMVYGFAEQAKSGNLVSDIELEQCIRRNFSGLDDLDPMKIFSRQFLKLKRCIKYPSPKCLPVSLIKDSLGRTENEGETRYLLVLTENYAALRLLQNQFADRDFVVIFGSSFPKDQQYTQICRNINRIKVCMETGTMVILLNLESLYESLYDALNQYYVYLDEQKYVDLGLGNHRVKCRVADKFKLIVVAEKDVVYKRFPIPLINRLEKHLLVMSTGLTEHQARLVKELEEWVKLFSEAKSEFPFDESSATDFKPGDCFVGYHSDTVAAVVMNNSDLKDDEQNFLQSKYTLLQCASPDAIARLPATELKHDAEKLWREYFINQKHGSLKDYLVHCLGNVNDAEYDGSLVQITTHSRLLSKANSRAIASAAGFTGSQFCCISLQEFHTEQQFVKALGDFFLDLGGAEGLLLVQCDDGEANFNLIACCRYLVEDNRRRTIKDIIQTSVKPIHIIFIIQLPKIAGGCQHFVGFQGGKWRSAHIDELLESNEQLPQIEQLINRSVSDLFKPESPASNDDLEDMEVNLDTSPEATLEHFPENDQQIIQQTIKPTLLLRNCLQPAAARIYDESADVGRATERIEILLQWLPDDGSQETEFSQTLIARIHKLLLERDQKCFEDQRLWLQHEALCQGHLQETGTFRKALWQKLSSIVSPIFSELIAYCDRNGNLNLLQEKEWKFRLWIQMLNEELITPLSYDSFIAPVSRRLRERACVKSTGAGHHFNGKFPFSWIIKDMVNVLLLRVQADSDQLMSLRGVFNTSPLGAFLKPLFENKTIKEEASGNYANDFLHMTYKPLVDGELQLIYDAMLAAAKQLHQLLYESEEFELDIPFIHCAYSLIQPRLVNFSDLVRAFPHLVKEMLKLRDRLNDGEMILDVVALEYCLQQLEPTPKDLENVSNRLVWCNRVQSIRPIIQVTKSLILTPSQQHEDNESKFNGQLSTKKSAHILQNCRAMWIRLDVVRMFIEHTCPPGQSIQRADATNGFQLWKALGENPDFSSVHTVRTIERFLSCCCDRMSKRLFKFDISQCEICKSPMKDPVQMPCDHVCCMSCASGWFKDHTACPVCRKEAGADFKVRVSRKYRNALEMYSSFRNRCKSFFMELVSLYCFGEQLPNADLVRKFITYVIKDENQTEDLTPFDEQGIDITPVIRSFILQQLLQIKERENEVYGHLQEYIRRASGLAERKEHLIEVCVLFVQCMEDVETMKLLKGKEGGANVQILMASQILERTLRTIPFKASPNALDINCLKGVAGIRAALDVLSQYLDDNFSENMRQFEALSKCLETAKHLCCSSIRSVIQFFLLKQLVRHSGIDAVKERCKRRELNWILPPMLEEQEKTPDTFIVHSQNYHAVREAFGKAVLTSTTDNLNDVITDLQAQPPARSCYVLLALFREITTSFSSVRKDDQILPRTLQKLKQYVAGIQYLSNELKGLAENFVTNFKSANGNLLQVRPRQSSNDRRLVEILVHFLVVMRCLPPNRILQPLAALAFNPASMMNAFIPTMPHDESPEILAASGGKAYECPNRHRYVITECGRPNQAYNCPTCGLPIGGVSHALAANNTESRREDRSSTGHILGQARLQPPNATPQRNLNPLSCSVLRCLTHVAMLLGTDQNMQSIAAIIKPQVQDVVQFLKEHIHHDIRCIARTTGNSEDEAVQIIHLVLVGIVNSLGQRRGNLNIGGNLSTKDSRKTWEDAFMTTYLNPVLSDISRLLQVSLDRMVRDERLGNNRLMKLVHELDVPDYETMNERDPMSPALWRYRKKITIQHLSSKFQEYSQGCDQQDKCEVLAEFLKKEHHLRALQYLPDILKLQRLLFEKFHRRLDRNEAEEYTMGKFLKRVPEMKKQLNALVDSFRMAWRIARSSLTEDGAFPVPKEMSCTEVKTQSTPISMFLPAKSGLGKCALALNNFLITLHNDFIGRCKSLLKDESSLPEIPLANITKAHLVAYDPDKDFLPMILANCDYSLRIGEGTMVEFNWKCLERQLVDRFIRGKPRLTSLVELFVFSKDICDGEVFKALKQKIHQVELTRPVQDQILGQLNQLTDVCDVLKSLHIAIGFLSSAGGVPSMSIRDYLHSGLKMTPKNGLKSGKAEHFCQLQHIVSLWSLLSLERARVLTKRKQDPFDDVSDKIKSPLNSKQKFELNGGLQKINVDRFVRELLEFILLNLKHGPEEQLRWPLSEYINAKLEEKDCDIIDNLEQHVPDDIEVKHAVDVWKVACQKSEDYHSKLQ